jgi:hypothetical protein
VAGFRKRRAIGLLSMASIPEATGRDRALLLLGFAGAADFGAHSLRAGFGAVFGQTPTLDSGDAPHIDLTAAQKQTVYQSVSKTQKNNAAPTGFRATVGALVPNSVVLATVPATIADLIPQTKGLESAMVEGQVVLVDPSGKKVMAVITQEP